METTSAVKILALVSVLLPLLELVPFLCVPVFFRTLTDGSVFLAMCWLPVEFEF